MDGEKLRRLVPFLDLPDEEVGSRELDDDTLASYQKQFNYSAEELDFVIRVLAKTVRKRSVRWAMIPYSPCSPVSRALFTTIPPAVCPGDKPPIDPLREVHVTSLATSIGRE
ncbi:glutamate synthase central domain-containing protein [Escherichia coli]